MITSTSYMFLTGTPVCSHKKDVQNFSDIFMELFHDKLSSKRILEKIGCVTNCHQTRFKAKATTINKKAPSILTANVTNGMTLMFGMPSDIMVTESEVFNYDFNSFLSDVGGYLGLLLGMSVSGLYDLFVRQLERAEEIINKKP